MANALLNNLSTAENFLLSSTKFWSSLSATAVIGALSTQLYTNTINNTGKYILSVILALHFILFFFFSNPENLKNTFSTFFHGSAMKWALRLTAMRVAYLLHSFPQQSEIGLIFVICVWIDVVAIARIIKPSIDYWITNSVFMAIVGRSNELYGFTGRYWLIMLLCIPIIYMQIRLDGYNLQQ